MRSERILWLLERPWVLWLLLLPVAMAYTQTEYWDYGADHWETTAAMRAVSENPLHPGNPMLALPGNTSPRFTPYTVAWGLLMKWLGLHVLLLMKLSAYANALLFVTGLSRLMKKLFNFKTLPNVMLLCMLLIWGTGYAFANSYEWWQFFYSLAHAAMFAYGLGFHALASLAEFTAANRLRDLSFYVLLSWIVFISHPITGVFIYVSAAAITLSEKRWRDTFLLQSVPLAGFGIALFWPYFDYAQVFFEGSASAWYVSLLYENQLAALGPILAGLPILVFFASRHRHNFAWIGGLLCLGVYLFSWAAGIQIGERFVFFVAFFLHLGIALFICEWIESGTGRPPKGARSRWFRSAVIAVIVLSAIPFLKHDVKMTGSLLLSNFVQRRHAETMPEKFGFLAAYLKSSDVVLTDSLSGFSLPALTGAKTVFHMHGNPLLVQELETRKRANSMFLSGPATKHERDGIVAAYGVTHILIDLTRPKEFSDQALMDFTNRGMMVAVQDSVRLYRLKPPESPS